MSGWVLDKKGEKVLATVKPDLQRVVRLAVSMSDKPFTIVQGSRTTAQQKAIFDQGRSKPGLIVTWTMQSRHIGGRAFDFAPLINGKISWNAKYYPPIAAAIKFAALQLHVPVRWGWDMWKKDYGHIQLEP